MFVILHTCTDTATFCWCLAQYSCW